MPRIRILAAFCMSVLVPWPGVAGQEESPPYPATYSRTECSTLYGVPIDRCRNDAGASEDGRIGLRAEISGRLGGRLPASGHAIAIGGFDLPLVVEEPLSEISVTIALHLDLAEFKPSGPSFGWGEIVYVASLLDCECSSSGAYIVYDSAERTIADQDLTLTSSIRGLPIEPGTHTLRVALGAAASRTGVLGHSVASLSGLVGSVTISSTAG